MSGVLIRFDVETRAWSVVAECSARPSRITSPGAATHCGGGYMASRRGLAAVASDYGRRCQILDLAPVG